MFNELINKVRQWTDQEWNHLHDVFLEGSGESLARDELEKRLYKLPADLQEDVRVWGIDDTSVRDKIIQHLRDKLKETPDVLPIRYTEQEEILAKWKPILEKMGVPKERMGLAAKLAENQEKHEARLLKQGKSVIEVDPDKVIKTEPKMIKENFKDTKSKEKPGFFKRIWNWVFG